MKFPALILNVFLFHGLQSVGQNIDSVKRQLVLHNDRDSVQVDILNELVTLYWVDKRDSAFYYGNMAQNLANEIKYSKGIAVASNYIGVIYFYGADYQKADEFFFKSISFCEQNNLIGPLAHAFSNAGMSQKWQGNFVQAIEFYLKALEYSEKAKDVRRKIKIMTALGMLYHELQNFDLAQRYLQNTFDEAVENHIQISKSLTTALGAINLTRKNYDEALKYFRLSLMDAKKSKDNFSIVLTLSNLGDCYLQMKQCEDAKSYIEDAFQMAKGVDSKNLKAVVLLRLGDLRLCQGRPNESTHFLLQSLELAMQIKSLGRALEAYKSLAEGYAMQNNFKEATRFWAKAYQLNDSIKSSNIISSIANAQRGYELSKKQSLIDQLNKEAELKELQLEKDKVEKNFLLFILCLVSVVVVIVLYIFYLRAKLDRELTQKSELKALRSQLNPHFIFNSLNVIQDAILANRGNEVIQYLGDFALLLRRTLENSFESFVPLEEEIMMIKLYLKAESVRFEDSFTWKIDVDKELDVCHVRTPSMLIQPFIENALLHGLLPKKGERVLHISFINRMNKLVCTIRDNGVGRKNALQNKNGHGGHVSRGNQIIIERVDLLNRAYKLNASLKIEDIQSEHCEPLGTQVEISLDLKSLD
jgi:tetratricopeptide (TPR) repeat protein